MKILPWLIIYSVKETLEMLDNYMSRTRAQERTLTIFILIFLFKLPLSLDF